MVVAVPPEVMPSAELRVSEPRVADCAKRLVELAVVAKKLVDVAFDEVELSAVKFCKVVEAVERRPLKEFAPLKVLLLARSVEEAFRVAYLLTRGYREHQAQGAKAAG